jgi:hypothetical protein
MILGADHITLSCEDLTSAVATLAEMGFVARFVSRDLPNHLRKQPFMRRFQPVLSMAFCPTNDGVALELTAQGSLPGAPSINHVLIARPPPWADDGSRFEADPSLAALWSEAMDCGAPVRRQLPAMQAGVWTSPRAEDGQRVVGMLVPVVELDRAVRFWSEALGCQLLSAGATGGVRWRRLAFSAPVRTWCLDVVLAVTGQVAPEAAVDAPGFPLLGLLSTNIGRDGDHLLRSGVTQTTGTFEVEVGDKQLTVAMYRAADGELIELVEVARGSRR